MGQVTRRRAMLALLLGMALLGATACETPTAPTAEFCGVDTVSVPVRIGGTWYRETLVIPRRCP